MRAARQRIRTRRCRCAAFAATPERRPSAPAAAGSAESSSWLLPRRSARYPHARAGGPRPRRPARALRASSASAPSRAWPVPAGLDARPRRAAWSAESARRACAMRRVTQRFGLGRCNVSKFYKNYWASSCVRVDFLAGLPTPRRARPVRAADRARERAGAQRGELRLEPFDAAEVGLEPPLGVLVEPRLHLDARVLGDAPSRP